MKQPSKTVANLKPYFFAGLTPIFAELQEKGVDVIRLDMGSPDLPPASFIVDTLIDSAKNPKKHGYSPAKGSVGFLNAVSTYYKRRFDVDIDPKTEALALIGSKEGLFNLNHTMLNPGDMVLLPDPYYPVYLSGAELASARYHFMPLTKENNFLPDFDAIPEDVAKEAKIMWLNYPNNPTGAVADLEFFKSKALKISPSNSIRSPKPTTWPAGVSAWLSVTKKLSACWQTTKAKLTPQFSCRLWMPDKQPSPLTKPG